jgi:hypothetical protein
MQLSSRQTISHSFRPATWINKNFVGSAKGEATSSAAPVSDMFRTEQSIALRPTMIEAAFNAGRLSTPRFSLGRANTSDLHHEVISPLRSGGCQISNAVA